MSKLWHNRFVFAYSVDNGRQNVKGVRFGTETRNITIGSYGGRWFVELNAL